MRTIKFRGKNSKGEWVVGDLLHNRGETFIAPNGIQNPLVTTEDFEVDPATVGQFTGLTDKNGVEIYEGDICKLLGTQTFREIKFREGVFGYDGALGDHIAIGQNYHFKWRNGQSEVVEAISPIHDNPELLKN